jgi:hypothetical protein
VKPLPRPTNSARAYLLGVHRPDRICSPRDSSEDGFATICGKHLHRAALPCFGFELQVVRRQKLRDAKCSPWPLTCHDTTELLTNTYQVECTEPGGVVSVRWLDHPRCRFPRHSELFTLLHAYALWYRWSCTCEKCVVGYVKRDWCGSVLEGWGGGAVVYSCSQHSVCSRQS